MSPNWYDLTQEQQEALPQELRSYDWCEAFKHSVAPITDVARVISCAEGQNEGDNWVGVFELKDGRFLYVTAWCDYTGWGCQEGGHSDTREKLYDVLIELLEEDDRRRLSIPLTKDLLLKIGGAA